MSTLDHLKKQAKHWLREVRRNNPGPVKRLRLAYPNAPASPGLRDVQHALAREHGYDNWKALRDATSLGAATDSAARDAQTTPAARFLQLACWDHTVHGRVSYGMAESAALRMLQRQPEIARDNLYCAIVCGDLAEVQRILDASPDLVDLKGGPRRWEPLLYACYARVNFATATEHAVAIARLLLDRGANPNAYYPAGDAVYSTLVGIAGEGEQDSSPHPQREAMYQLLLERGAELYDPQVLYNTHFHGNVLWWLELTHAHAQRTGKARDWSDPEWPMFDMGAYGSGARFLLSVAIHHDNVALARWLLEHGANPNAAPMSDPRFSTRTLYEDAALAGRHEIAELLARHGAIPRAPVLTGEDAFVAACRRLDRDAAAAAVTHHPEYLTSPKAMFAAAASDNADAVALLLELGTSLEIEDTHGQRALHVAAQANALRVATLLIERGAEVDRRERRWNATPIGFATYQGRQAMRELLGMFTRDVWNLTYLGNIARLAEVLAAEPGRAHDVSVNGLTALDWLPDDDALAVRAVDVLIAHGADPSFVTKDGKTAADRARERGLEGAAARLSAAAAGGSTSGQR